MNGLYELFQPADTWIGAGAVERIPFYVEKIGCRHALIVSDAGLVKAGIVGKITTILDKAGLCYTLYTDVKPNPATSIVDRASKIAREAGCDYIIGIGGGSPLDVAKSTAIILTNGGEVRDYEGIDKSKVKGLPVIAVNTTAGTGSEVTRDYVITDEERKVKMLMVDRNCLAALAINDPKLMVGMSPEITAATGLDALTHAIEAYTAKGHYAYTDTLALGAIRLIAKSLVRAVEDGRNMDARTDMCWAEYMAGLAFSNAGLGMVHAMAHQLGGVYNIPHGVANAILLPYVMEFNRKSCKTRYAEIAGAMNLNLDGGTVEQASIGLIKKIANLAEKLKIPKLKSLGFRYDDVMLLSSNAQKDVCITQNPVECSITDIRNVFLKAYNENLFK